MIEDIVAAQQVALDDHFEFTIVRSTEAPQGASVRFHNAARSQMAEGIFRHLSQGAVEVYSAGTEPTGVHPLAVRALRETGIDISGQRSKHVDELAGQTFDVVATLCDSAREVCPVFPGDPERIHWSFPDPGAAVGTEEERLQAFRQTARELTMRLRPFLALVEHHTERSRA